MLAIQGSGKIDYNKLAEELIYARCKMSHMPAHNKINDLSKGEIFVLNYLAYSGQQALPSKISEDMSVSSARIASILNSMETKGWVKRATDINDRRHTIITLMPAGLKAADAIRANAIKFTVNMLEKLGEEDAKEFVRINQKLMKEFTNKE